MEIVRLNLAFNTVAEQLQTACLLEAAARKAGNVHPQAAFEDTSFEDFVRSAEILAPILANQAPVSVGKAVLATVQQTMASVGTNTNLGISLLLGPLAAVPEGTRCADGIDGVLQQLSMEDTEAIFAAIRVAQPGGLGRVRHQDVSERPTVGILAAMQLAAERDLIARQYTNGFAEILEFGCEKFLQWSDRQTAEPREASTPQEIPAGQWEQAIIGTQLEFLAHFGDSLIARKCGPEVSVEASRRAGLVLSAGWSEDASARRSFTEFDSWLRGDAHRRNPGTTADLIAAVIFALLRDGRWTPPPAVDITQGPPRQTSR